MSLSFLLCVEPLNTLEHFQTNCSELVTTRCGAFDHLRFQSTFLQFQLITHNIETTYYIINYLYFLLKCLACPHTEIRPAQVTVLFGFILIKAIIHFKLSPCSLENIFNNTALKIIVCQKNKGEKILLLYFQFIIFILLFKCNFKCKSHYNTVYKCNLTFIFQEALNVPFSLHHRILLTSVKKESILKKNI